jgi:multiple sugar transport system substrate-binding protein
VVPDAWKAAWEWYYTGIWGDQPFIPNGASAGSADFGSGNTFASGKVAMAVLPNWYLCCLIDYGKAGNTFQMGILPSYNGKPNGRVDADTFRVWKGTQHPAEAVEVVKFLVTTAVDKLVVGSAAVPPAYGAVPAVTAKQQPFLDAKAAIYPFVTPESWAVMMAGLAYPDVPSAEGYMPNYNEAWARLGTFGDLMNNTEGLDLAAEIAILEADLTAIFNK